MNASRTYVGLTEGVEIRTLSPSVDLLVRRVDHNDIVAIAIVLSMGAREESLDQAGIATLALRMLTRGTSGKSDSEIAVALESIGASFTTDVQKDRAQITVLTTLSKYGETVAIVEELLRDSTFPEEPFQVEKDILIQEIREDLDSPFTSAYRLFQETLFANHPYGKSASGTEETVGALSHEAVKGHFKRRFGAGKTTISVVGDLDPNTVEESISRLIGPLSNRGKDAPLSEPEIIPDRDAPKEKYLERATEAECIVYGFPTPGLLDPSYATWKVLDSIMGGGMDSRLFAEIREKRGLVYQIGSSFPGLEWRSAFVISLISTLQNHDKILENLANEVRRMRDELPSDDEVARAKTYLKGIFLMSQERNGDQAALLAKYHSLGLGIDFIDRYPMEIEAVDAESIREAANARLTDPTIAIVGPGAS